MNYSKHVKIRHQRKKAGIIEHKVASRCLSFRWGIFNFQLLVCKKTCRMSQSRLPSGGKSPSLLLLPVNISFLLIATSAFIKNEVVKETVHVFTFISWRCRKEKLHLSGLWDIIFLLIFFFFGLSWGTGNFNPCTMGGKCCSHIKKKHEIDPLGQVWKVSKCAECHTAI